MPRLISFLNQRAAVLVPPCYEKSCLRPILFQDIQKKCDGGELSTKPLDLRGLLAALRLIHAGLEGNRALELGLVNKSFDGFERQLVLDVIRARLPETIRREDVFA